MKKIFAKLIHLLNPKYFANVDDRTKAKWGIQEVVGNHLFFDGHIFDMWYIEVPFEYSSLTHIYGRYITLSDSNINNLKVIEVQLPQAQYDWSRHSVKTHRSSFGNNVRRITFIDRPKTDVVEHSVRLDADSHSSR